MKIELMRKIEVVPIGSIKPYENNPRVNDDAVLDVANSIQSFGFDVPITVDRDGVIVTGHTRYKAAQHLKLKEVPVIRLSQPRCPSSSLSSKSRRSWACATKHCGNSSPSTLESASPIRSSTATSPTGTPIA